jgi:hypothetical protein
VSVALVALPILVGAFSTVGSASPGFLNSSGVPITTPPPQQPEQLPTGTYSGRPLNAPTGPQASVADCPTDLAWSPPLPAGATVSASIMPAGPEGVVVVGTTVSTAGDCAYTVNTPSSTSTGGGVSPDTNPTVVNLGNVYFPSGGVYNLDMVNSYGQVCTTNAELLNGYGNAFAEQELTNSNCNATSFAAGYAIAVNTSEQEALVVYEYPSYNHWYASYRTGSIFYGIFQECMENPIPSSTYLCYVGNYGPLL